MASMAFHHSPGLFVLVHNSNAPADAEWGAYIEEVKKERDPSKFVTLVFTDGGSPTHAQRAALNLALGYTSTPTAVLSDSGVVRGVVSALNFFNNQIRTFAPNALKQAFDHLRMSPELRQRTQEELKRLGEQIDSRTLRMAA
ncbi:MAG: hypothetical protein QM765_36930 [Myxococcales bacterium]